MSERILDLVDRLRGRYVVAVNDGAGPLNGKMTFEQKSAFPVRPIMLEAANEIERLRAVQPKPLTRADIERAVDEIFTSCHPRFPYATRIVLVGEEVPGDKKHDLGGWCRESVVSLLMRELRVSDAKA